MFLNGFDVLKLRLAELADYMDQFVIVESPFNFHGDPKPLYFKENPITGYNIRHVVVETPRHTRIGPKAELAQDNMIGAIQEGFREGTRNCDASDQIFLGDFDEIPRPSKLMDGPLDTTVGFVMNWYLYYINWKASTPIEGTCRTPFGLIEDFWSAISHRYAVIENKHQIQNGGWHLSSFGGVDLVMEKLAGFPATDMGHLKREEVEEDMLNGRDIFHGGQGTRHIGFSPINSVLPKALLDNLKEYQQLIHPDFREFRLADC